MKLKEAAKKVEDGFEETLTYCDFPSEHWTKIRTNNVIERLNREIRRRTRVVGCFPDGNSALMLVCARLRHVAGTQWGNKKYMNMKHLKAIGGIAQLGERLNGIQEVSGSIPLISTTGKSRNRLISGLFLCFSHLFGGVLFPFKRSPSVISNTSSNTFLTATGKNAVFLPC